MLDRNDSAMLLAIKEKRDNGTLAITASSLIALGMALGAIAIYDHMIKTHKAKKEEE